MPAGQGLLASPTSMAGSRAALRAGDHVDLRDAEEAAVLRTTRRLLRDRDLDDDRYREAAAVIGADRVFELTTLVGYYSTLALQLRVFGVV